MTPLAGLMTAVNAAVDGIGGLDGRFLVPALALQLLAFAFRALAWRGVLGAAYPDRRIPVFSVACAYASGVALNAFLPGRGGEVAKVALVRAQIPGSAVPTIAASLTVVLALDACIGISLVGIFWTAGVLPELPAIPAPDLKGGFVLTAMVAGAAVLVAGACTRHFAAMLRRVFASALQGLSVLRSPSRYAITVLPFQLGAWACRIGVVFLVLHAFRIDAGLETATLVVVLAGASTAVPVPGGAGSQQLLAAYALQGVASTAGAVSFSLGMQVGITVLNTAIGLTAAMIMFRTLRPVSALREIRARVG